MGIERTRVLTRIEEEHPVIGMLDQAESSQPPGAVPPEPTPRSAAPTPPATAPHPTPAEAQPESGKKQVNYRLDPSLIEDLKRASIVYSYRQRGRISQNQIVEMAVRGWLDENGPWDG
jgi:hypothetical protein